LIVAVIFSGNSVITFGSGGGSLTALDCSVHGPFVSSVWSFDGDAFAAGIKLLKT
jgi:hypothetical protein